MFGFKTGASAKDEKKPAPSGTTNPITDYASGGATRRRMEALGLKDGGMVRGPGTGTSDDVKAVVPEGSYIMPADSTEAIGPETLASMGKPVPVNLSNGEYQMPPEQVHAIGAQVLDQMKDATHEPVGPRGFNAQDGELYFADGGKVESTDELIARISAKYGTSTSAAPKPDPTPVAQRQAPRAPAAPSIGSAADALRNRRRQIDAAAGYRDGGVVEDDERKGMSGMQERAFNAERNMAKPQTAPGLGMSGRQRSEEAFARAKDFAAGRIPADEYASSLKPGNLAYQDNSIAPKEAGDMRGLGSIGNSLAETGGLVARGVADALTPGHVSKSVAVQEEKPAPQRPNAPSQAGGTNTPAAQGFDPAALTELERNKAGHAYRKAWQRESPGGLRNATDAGLGFYNAEQQVRGTNITARRGANGVMEFSGNGEGALPQSYTQGFDMALGNERMARANAIRQGMDAPESGQGYGFGRQGPSVGMIGDGMAAQRERDALIRAASTPYPGSQNGQLTANQLRVLAGLVEGDQRAATEAANQQAATERTAMQEEGANARSQSRDDIDRRRLQSDEQVRDFEIRRLERVENLYQQLENAKTPEERASIAEELRALSGKEAPNRYTVVPGGQEIDPVTNMAVTRPARVFNNQTGQFVEQQAGQAAPAAPRPGEVRNGYRFKGGNPADQASWEKV